MRHVALVERVRTHYQIRRTVNEDGSLIDERIRVTPEVWWEDQSWVLVVPRTPEIYDV